MCKEFSSVEGLFFIENSKRTISILFVIKCTRGRRIGDYEKQNISLY